MNRAIDYAYGWTPAHTAKFKAHEIAVVLRYVGIPTAGKCMGKAELVSLHAAGIGVGFIYESTAQWMLGGSDAGKASAERSRNHIRALGGPEHPFVWFAADWDVQPDQMGAVIDTLRGAASVLGAEKVGIYGGIKVCSAALDKRAAAKAWQTVAWSYGASEGRAVLHQVLGREWGDLGLAYDTDRAYADDVGQWPTPHPLRVTVDVPRGVYAWQALWRAFWPIRKNFRPQAGKGLSKYRIRLSAPWAAWNNRQAWNAGWEHRNAWREAAK